MNKLRKVTPLLIFLVGIISSLLLVRTLGTLTLGLQQFQETTRFSGVQSSAGNFYPTPRQLEIWALQKIGSRKNVVIIGGSSVMYGVGQAADETIAARLQSQLGNSWSVLNMALQAGGTFGQGQYVANALKKRGKNVIYVADAPVAYIPPVSNSEYYKNFYWQARYAGFLEPPTEFDSKLSEEGMTLTRFLALTNNLLFYQELINWTSYNIFPLVQSPLMGSFLKPLRLYKDIGESVPYERRYLDEEHEELEFRIVKGAVTANISDSSILKAAKDFRVAFSHRYEAKVILVYCHYNPRYWEILPETATRKYQSYSAKQVASLNYLGLEAFEACNGFSDRDYSDATHLSPEGAEKVAKQLAKYLRRYKS